MQLRADGRATLAIGAQQGHAWLVAPNGVSGRLIHSHMTFAKTLGAGVLALAAIAGAVAVACSGNDAGGGGAAADGGSSAQADGGPSTANDGEGGSSVGNEGGGGSRCGADDPILADAGISEPSLPSPSNVCATIQGTQAVAAGGAPSTTSLDTQAIQNALDDPSCQGKAVRLVANGANNALVSGPLTIHGVTLWVDAGVTLYFDPGSLVAATSVIKVSGTNPGIVGDGVIDGQGGEPNAQDSGVSWWELHYQASTGKTLSVTAPGLVEVDGTTTGFVMYRITIHNSPGYHLKLNGKNFVIWGTTFVTPSRPTNSKGTAFDPRSAHNTDAIDPGSGASGDTQDGYIVCNTISVGDDHIAIKSIGGAVDSLTIAHNHFGAGHGMSIGSETLHSISNIRVYDLTIDGTVFKGASAVDTNGLRIKSAADRGSPVTNVAYTNVCTRDLTHPILLDPNYSDAGGSMIPLFSNITMRDFRQVADSPTVRPHVNLDGYDQAHPSTVTLDNVVVDGIADGSVTASNAVVTILDGGTNFTVPGSSAPSASHPLDCTGRFIDFPITFP